MDPHLSIPKWKTSFVNRINDISNVILGIISIYLGTFDIRKSTCDIHSVEGFVHRV